MRYYAREILLQVRIAVMMRKFYAEMWFRQPNSLFLRSLSGNADNLTITAQRDAHDHRSFVAADWLGEHIDDPEIQILTPAWRRRDRNT